MTKKFKHIVFLTRQEIINLVSQADLGEASEYLWELAEMCNQAKSNEVVALKCSINRLEKERLSGTLDFQTISMEENKLAVRLLGIAQSLIESVEQ